MSTLTTKSRGRQALTGPIRPQGLIMTRIVQEIPEPKAFPWPVDEYTPLPITQPGEPAEIQVKRTPRRDLNKNIPFYRGSHARVKW